MDPIELCVLPSDALLRRHADRGAYTDCYATDMAGVVSQLQYIDAFYTTWVFKLERAILRLAVSKPSSDAQARQLAQGEIGAFAAWTVEDRNERQLLMSDYLGRTRSWLMTTPLVDAAGSQTGTRIYFGSAVVPTPASVQRGRPQMGFVFRALLGFHRLYSRILLGAARSRLSDGR